MVVSDASLIPWPHRRRRLSISLAAVAALSGCYSGVQSHASGGGFGPGADGSAGAEGSEGSTDSDDSGPDGPPPVSAHGCEDPGAEPSPLRRLTVEQYRNTIRDLLDLTVDEGALSVDDRLGSFAVNVSAVDELAVERYMSTAEDLAAEAAADLPSLMGCDPAAADPEACLDGFIRDFGRRTYRRPLSDDEHHAYRAMADELADVDGLDTAVEAVAATMLASPNFLYRVETVDPQTGVLDRYSVASRVSYALWNSMPDDELLAAAEAGELDEPEDLRAQAERMLDDPRAARTLASFHEQWLGLQGLQALEKDTERFPEFRAQREAMKDETARFVAYVMDEADGRLETLLTAPYTVGDPTLASLYGVDPSAVTPDERLMLPADQRAGLLTQPAFLAAHAHTDQSSPVLRGVFVREELLCLPLPVVPEDVDNVPPPVSEDESTKDRFDAHTDDPRCSGCHSLIDPVGWAFEHYDADGSFREMDAGEPVDATARIEGVNEAEGEFAGAVPMMQHLAKTRVVHHCVTAKWFQYGLAREPGEADQCALDSVADAFVESGGDVRELLVSLVTSDAFRFGQAPR